MQGAGLIKVTNLQPQSVLPSVPPPVPRSRFMGNSQTARSALCLISG